MDIECLGRTQDDNISEIVEKLLDHEASNKWNEELPDTESKQDETNEEIVKILRNDPGCDDINSNAVNEWMKSKSLLTVT